MKLSCVSQNYAWGKSGKDSVVALLLKKMSERGCGGGGVYGTADTGSFATAPFISDMERYAELWMGTHQNGPSALLRSAGGGCGGGGTAASASNTRDSGTPLKEFLSTRPALVGSVPSSCPPNDLPFLFKVLSVGTALSIQAHPDKTLAAQLHAQFPSIYKDSNHKPEMAVALTTFEALCGFRSLQEIQAHIQTFPEFREILGPAVVQTVEQRAAGVTATAAAACVYREIFAAYVQCEPETMQRCLANLVTRLQREEAEQQQQRLKQEQQVEALGSSSASVINGGLSLAGLILRLQQQYPGDCGIIAPLMLNYLTLAPGQSFFMGAGVPHAYLAGDCVECMALSDNVVRMGLTPKLKDVPTLLQMLEYKHTEPTDMLISPVPVPVPFDVPVDVDGNIETGGEEKGQGGQGYTMRYRPPLDICEEFEVELSAFPPSAGEVVLRALPCASIILVYRGSFSATITTTAAAAVVSSENGCSITDDAVDNIADDTTAGCGDVLFLPANCCLKCMAHNCCDDANDNDGIVVLYRAHMNCME